MFSIPSAVHFLSFPLKNSSELRWYRASLMFFLVVAVIVACCLLWSPSFCCPFLTSPLSWLPLLTTVNHFACAFPQSLFRSLIFAALVSPLFPLCLSLSLCLLVSHPSHPSLSLFLSLSHIHLPSLLRLAFLPPPPDRLSRRPYPMLDSRYFFFASCGIVASSPYARASDTPNQ